MPCQFNHVYETIMLSRNVPRQIIALLIALYAIAFAFGAMAAIRWPSLMMLASFAFEADPLSEAASIDWRELGILFGAPYFLAAIFLYASAMVLNKRKRGAIALYTLGSVSGFPCVLLADFEPGWWRDPSAGEGAIAGAALTAIILGIAVWNLRYRDKEKSAPKPLQPNPDDTPQTIITGPQTSKKTKSEKPKRHGPVPAAIARQRAQFAADGRRMLAKQHRP